MLSFIHLAFRNIWRNHRRSLITITTMLVGVFIVFTIRSFLNGFQTELIQINTEKTYGDMQIHKAGYEDNVSGDPFDYLVPFDENIQKAIREVEGVDAVTGHMYTIGLINNQATQKTAFATGGHMRTEWVIIFLLSMWGPAFSQSLSGTYVLESADGRSTMALTQDSPSQLRGGYIAADGTIKEIYDMKPESLKSVSSRQSVRYALEVNQGLFERLGIEVGDTVVFPESFLTRFGAPR